MNRVIVVKRVQRVQVIQPRPLVASVSTLPQGPAGPPGVAGPNTISNSTTVGTLSDLTGTYSLLGLTPAGTGLGRLGLSADVRSLLGAANAEAVRSAIGAGTPYTLPIASTGTIGGVRVGSGLSIDGSGVLSASGGANPAGTGSELQFRAGASAFGALSGSSVSGSTLTLTAPNATSPALQIQYAASPTGSVFNLLDSAGQWSARLVPHTVVDGGSASFVSASLQFPIRANRTGTPCFIRPWNNGRGIELGGGEANEVAIANSGIIRTDGGIMLSTSANAAAFRTGTVGSGLYRGNAGTQAYIVLSDQTGGPGTNGWRIGAMASGDVAVDAAFFETTYIRFLQPLELPSITDATAKNNSMYFSTTANRLVYKDAGGTVNNLY
jgi:hypothetical protein